jgi:hypothetical protein
LGPAAPDITGRGPWKKRLPEIVASLEALGRLRFADGERSTVMRS